MNNVNWVKSEIIINGEILIGHRFMMIGGFAQIFGAKNAIYASSNIVSFEHLDNGAWAALTVDGDIWEVRKLNCNCPPGKL